jgi:hypothetical protein
VYNVLTGIEIDLEFESIIILAYPGYSIVKVQFLPKTILELFILINSI